MTEIVTVPEAAITIGSSEAERPVRKAVLEMLNHLPNVVDFIGKVSPKDTFRAVISPGNVGLHRPGLNGLYRAGLHGVDGRIVENAAYLPTGPDFIALGPNVVMFIAMRVVAARLASIDTKLDVIGDMLVFGQHGRLRGAINALGTAGRISGAEDRRRSMLQACSVLEVEVLATAGLLKAQIGAMPEETTGRLQGLFGSGFAKAKRAFEPVCETVAAIGSGTAALLQAYAALEEAEAGRFALRQIVDDVTAAGMADAIRKARLLPAVGGRAPEAGLVVLAQAVDCVGGYLLGTAPLSVALELQAEEFSLV